MTLASRIHLRSPGAALSSGKLAVFFATAMMLFLAGRAEAQQFDYSAVLAGQGKVNGPVNAGGIVWQCNPKYCTTRGPWPVPGVKSCNALAMIVGPLASYGYKGRMLSPSDMATCNGNRTATATTGATPPQNPLAAIIPGLAGLGTKPLPGGSLPSSTPFSPSTSQAGTGGVSFRTATLTVTGTGALDTPSSFAPVTFRTSALQVTGTAFSSITVRTGALTVTGTGPP